MKKNNFKKTGFTIVETLVTLVAITIMIAGPLVFVYKTYTYSTLVKNKIIATGLSQEGLELATSLRNFDLATFQSAMDSYCTSSCEINWNGIDPNPTVTSCSPDDKTCELYQSSTDPNIIFTHDQNIGTEDTGFYRYLKVTKNGDQSYSVESIAGTNAEDIKIKVDLKKIIFNIDVK